MRSRKELWLARDLEGELTIEYDGKRAVQSITTNRKSNALKTAAIKETIHIEGIAIDAGDIELVQGELGAVVSAVRLSRATFKKIKQNLFWAFFYNVVMVPLAIIGVMHPVLAEIAMAFSSINVATNSRRLQRVNIQEVNS